MGPDSAALGTVWMPVVHAMAMARLLMWKAPAATPLLMQLASAVRCCPFLSQPPSAFAFDGTGCFYLWQCLGDDGEFLLHRCPQCTTTPQQELNNAVCFLYLCDQPQVSLSTASFQHNKDLRVQSWRACWACSFSYCYMCSQTECDL